jgi:hypothetical protein
VIFEWITPKEKSGIMDLIFLLRRALQFSKNRASLSYITMVKNFLVKFLKK